MNRDGSPLNKKKQSNAPLLHDNSTRAQAHRSTVRKIFFF